MGTKSDLTKPLSRSKKVTHLKTLSELSICGGFTVISCLEALPVLLQEKKHSEQLQNNEELSCG